MTVFPSHRQNGAVLLIALVILLVLTLLAVSSMRSSTGHRYADLPGRAGRVAEGVAWRLWPQSQRLESQRRAGISQVELASLALELAAWGSDALRFPDAPPPGKAAKPAAAAPEKPAANVSSKSLESRLHKLDGLYKSGAISKDEYDKRRGEILSEI